MAAREARVAARRLRVERQAAAPDSASEAESSGNAESDGASPFAGPKSGSPGSEQTVDNVDTSSDSDPQEGGRDNA
jgi:hypothetical protein